MGTPQSKTSDGADLSYLVAATEALLPHLAAGSAVVGKSTVPVGTVDMLRGVLSPRPDVLLGWNPEFLRQGTAVKDSLVPDRLVYGVPDGGRPRGPPAAPARTGHRAPHPPADSGAAITAALDAVYAPLLAAGIPRLVCNFATAELIKSASNAYLATKLSFINAMAELCDATGADVKQLGAAMGLDPRIGSRYLHAGLGFGGGCLPKDIRSLRVQAAGLGVDSVDQWMDVVDSINRDQRSRTVGLARELCGGQLGGRRVTVLGAAFKPDTDDIRDSPALDVALQLASAGAHVTVTDPAAINNAWLRYPQLRFEPSTAQALDGAELVLLLTEWDEYAALSPGRRRGTRPTPDPPGRPERPRRLRLGGGRLDGPRPGPGPHRRHQHHPPERRGTPAGVTPTAEAAPLQPARTRPPKRRASPAWTPARTAATPMIS